MLPWHSVTFSGSKPALRKWPAEKEKVSGTWIRGGQQPRWIRKIPLSPSTFEVKTEKPPRAASPQARRM